MAQALATLDDTMESGIDAAVARLEQAFLRIESAVGNVRRDFRSLTLDNEKLNRLLREADDKMLRLKDVTGEVSRRLDRTIGALEALEQ